MSLSAVRAANSSGVNAPFVRAPTSAPCASSTLATSRCPSETAHIRAVCPLEICRAFTSAP